VASILAGHGVGYKIACGEWAAARHPKGGRALTCFWQAVLGLRWFHDRIAPNALARDHGISPVTAYRYLDEMIEVIVGQAPDLRQTLERARQEGYPHVILDGTIIAAEEGREQGKSARIANACAGSSRRASAAKGGKGGSYSDWSKQGLLKRAKQIGIKGRSAMNKKQLVNALRNH
jgi:hypothetical protein